MQEIAGVILAGGAGSRLGGADKALLRLGGETLLGHVAARLRPQLGVLALSSNRSAELYAGHGLPVLADGIAEVGPLAGVLAGLRWAERLGARQLVSVPVDTVFLPADLVAGLAPAPAAASWRGHQHYLVAAWEVGFAGRLEDGLRCHGLRRVRDALALAGARFVEFGGDEDPFLNINAQAELELAQMRLLRT